MHIVAKAVFGGRTHDLYVKDPHPYCGHSDTQALSDSEVRMLTAVIAGDPLVKKDGFLFADGEPRFYLFGQQQTENEGVWDLNVLVAAGLIKEWPGGSASPALIPYRVTEHGFAVAKALKAFRAKVYDLA
jgi:hypothetical protein